MIEMMAELLILAPVVGAGGVTGSWGKWDGNLLGEGMGWDGTGLGVGWRLACLGCC